MPYEILGTLNPLFKNEGFRIKYVNFGRHPNEKPKLDNYNGLVILGGAMNVDQMDEYPHLKTEIDLIQEAVKMEIPVLGICLGAQLVAKALGSQVYANNEKEIGWYDVSLTADGKKDPLLSHLHSTEKIFQWHGYTFDLPTDSTLLATTTGCKHQAFRYKDKVYGFQFHMEVDEAMILRWLDVPIHKKELKELAGKIEIETIKSETELYIDRLKDISEVTFGNFISLFNIKKKGQLLPSK
ncbi:hypothetical protein BVY03_03745 [bacterium K02(2017)]|nr:hypothetical protein BVY03_03745 [bacterium K02(2017)]